MSATQATLPPPSTALQLLEARVLPEFGAFWLTRPWLSSVARRGDRHPVLVLPGLMADEWSTQALRGFLNSHDYTACGWGLGRNVGLRPNLELDMLARIDELFERHGRRRVSLVGWSLGGPYARQLAKIVPGKVRCVISLGSPFAGSPKSTHAWRAYEMATGSLPEDQDVPDTLAEAPPVPTTSVFSRSDGVVTAGGWLAEIRPRCRLAAPVLCRLKARMSGRTLVMGILLLIGLSLLLSACMVSVESPGPVFGYDLPNAPLEPSGWR